MNAHIYIVTNKINGKQYVGQTTVDRNKVGHGMAMTEAYAVYGKDNFVYERICSDINNQKTLNCLEKFWIATCGTIAPNGYNIEAGGRDRDGVSQETRKKLSVINKGKKVKEETKEKIRQAMLGCKNPFFGKSHSPESRKKISLKSAAFRQREDYVHWNQGGGIRQDILEKLIAHNTGKKRSAESIAKQIEKRLGKKNEIVTCPNCGKLGGESLMKRYHFENCKGTNEIRARVTHNGKRIHLGRFTTKEEAKNVMKDFYASVNKQMEIA
jgi:group I intron endonuclease